jgi:hypothetical protein
MGEHGPGGNDGVLIDHFAGKNDGARSQTPTFAHDDSFEVFEALGCPAQEIVVAGDDSRRHETVVADFRVGGDVGVRFQFAAFPDPGLILYRHSSPDDRVFSDGDLFAHRGEIRNQYAGVDGAPGVEHGSCTDDAPVADPSSWLTVCRRDGACGRLHRLLSDNRVVIDANKITDFGVVMNDHVMPDRAVSANVHSFTDHREVPDGGALTEACGRRDGTVHHPVIDCLDWPQDTVVAHCQDIHG